MMALLLLAEGYRHYL